MKEENVKIKNPEAAMPDFSGEITALIRGNSAPLLLKEKLGNFHAKDIAEALEGLSQSDRKKLYRVLDSQTLSEILEHFEEDEAVSYLNEIDIKKVPLIIEDMETDSAVSILKELEPDRRSIIMELMDDKARESISLAASFSADEVGSRMTTNFILIKSGLSIKEAMSSLIAQAARNDNIATLFVENSQGVFCGAIDLKDLITARQGDSLDGIVINSFPYVYAQESLEDCLEELKEYSESSVPVLDNENRILGVITSQNLIEASDDAMGEDYAMLAGLTAQEDLEEPLGQSLKKRLPWLLILLGLGLVVSSVVGLFEQVVAQLSIIIAFQSLVLDMAGNVGTQSLAVTIRVLSSGGLSFKEKLGLVGKEMKVGFVNGSLLGILSALSVGLFIFLSKGQTLAFSYAVSGCIGLALMLSMLCASASGTLIPMFFEKIGVDPAVASGPLITTVNDLVAVVCYYGLCWIFLLNLLHFGA